MDLTSSELKLRATARLADGGEDATFEACVLLHEAARLERRIAQALPPRLPEAGLSGAIEECWCLVEGRDPLAAADVWGRILLETETLPRKLTHSMLCRLRPRYTRAVREFARALQQHAELGHALTLTISVPSSTKERARKLGAVAKLLDRFPGVSTLWMLASRLEELAGDGGRAWGMLSRALRLDPENASLRALSLPLAVRTLGPGKGDTYLSETRSRLPHAEPELSLMYAFSEIWLAERVAIGRRQRFQRAFGAVNAAFPRARLEWMTRALTGVRLFLHASLAGQKADPDLLHRAGLGRLAATSAQRPLDALRADAIERVSALSVSGAGAWPHSYAAGRSS
jgi:hypothetical protein